MQSPPGGPPTAHPAYIRRGSAQWLCVCVRVCLVTRAHARCRQRQTEMAETIVRGSTLRCVCVSIWALLPMRARAATGRELRTTHVQTYCGATNCPSSPARARSQSPCTWDGRRFPAAGQLPALRGGTIVIIVRFGIGHTAAAPGRYAAPPVCTPRGEAAAAPIRHGACRQQQHRPACQRL